MAGETHYKSGITTISEQIDREFLGYKSVKELNEAWTQKLAQAMVEQKRALKDQGDREAFAVMKSPAAQKKYSELCKKISDGNGEHWNSARIEEEWENVQKEAIARYRTLLMRASAPPLPEKVAPASPAEEEDLFLTEGISIVPDELPDSLNPEHGQWTAWRATPLNNDTIEKLKDEFSHVLAKELPTLSDEQVQEVRKLYESIVGDMYETTYPGDRERIESALESYWRMLLESTRLIAPVEQRSK